MTRTRCRCGKVMSKYSSMCNSCHKSHMAELHKEAREIIATNKCPDCGSGLHRNLALFGWWQCDRFGRLCKEGKPCNFQTFTGEG